MGGLTCRFGKTCIIGRPSRLSMLSFLRRQNGGRGVRFTVMPNWIILQMTSIKLHVCTRGQAAMSLGSEDGARREGGPYVYV